MDGKALRERELIALGGLIHDIGKFWQRKREEEGQRERSEESQHFGYAHAEFGFNLVRELFENRGGKDIILSSFFHHKPNSEHEYARDDLKVIRAIYRLADWYASTERSELTDIESEKLFKRLKPVFQTVNLFNQCRSEGEYYYKLSPLSLDKEVIFPENLYEAKDYVKGKEDELFEEYYGSYKNLWDEFWREFSRIKEIEETSKALSLAYSILYKYLWCVPASIYDRERYHSHYPDVSLFDHSRVVSALATSLYTDYNLKVLEDYNDRKRENFAQEVRLVLFEGDVSGIQRFLYDLANYEKVAKRLRGRSLFLTLLPEIAGRYILKELGYPFVNLLYVGGGKFQAIIGYEEGIEEKLKDLATEIEKTLIREFGGKLGFVLYFKNLALSDLREYYKVVKELMERGEEQKKRKFSLTIQNFKSLANRRLEGATQICPSCRWEVIPEGEEVCSWCERFAEVGGFLPKAQYLLYTSKKPSVKNLKGFYLEPLGGFYLSDSVDTIPVKEFEEVSCLNSTEIQEGTTGFRFLALTVPRKQTEEGTEVKTFEDLSEEAEGDQKIAFVMADVDNMGLIFMKGLGEKNYTISRVATLSRSLDLFFSGYLNKLFQEEKFKDRVYTLYGGGDDLFIVVPWDTALKAIERIREDFGEYTCRNRCFGLSSGVFVSGGSFPVRIAGDRVREAEKRAKSEEKDRICVLDEVLGWDELKKAVEKAERVAKEIELKEIGRTNLYRIYMLLRTYGRAKGSERLMFYPYFYYFLNRNVKGDEHRRLIEDLFIDQERDYEIRDSALFTAKYLLMKTRGVRSGAFKSL
ncbi:MAG: type III-A CRISPR-associated protein Cas10/Csm1 [Hydrogenobacter thermophilus]|uniref:type III-A CRISPR-associated protein Cas10/Csm1 n=1 Tax=Hydrogenobacter thermophilus TaxID=940 RepID=UPI001C77A07A|nr:type III-A CRISPR-associated protein Cas10/Csm1 [Hydrogenobacter thermophilus]QWK20604.1 MAG: type III-A CRISPR-associated protein Cas10/Csm1 [Hydrogenobacter thermophilus]